VKDYSAIPGLGTGRGSFQVGIRKRLYQGADHLLLIQSTGYSEDYRRVFYRDIRCVIIRRNRRYLWFSLVFAGSILLVVALVLAIYSRSSLGGSWLALTILVAPLALMLAVHLMRGPTCDCYVTTGVQTVVLPTPQRVDKVARLLDFLQAKIPGAPATAPTS
jgi:hypothetical protein